MARIPLPHETVLSAERHQSRLARRAGFPKSGGVGSSVPVGPRVPTPKEAVQAEREGRKAPPPLNPALSPEEQEKVLEAQRKGGADVHHPAFGEVSPLSPQDPPIKVAEGGVSNQGPGHIDSGLGGPFGGVGEGTPVSTTQEGAGPFVEGEHPADPAADPVLDLPQDGVTLEERAAVEAEHKADPAPFPFPDSAPKPQ